MSFEHLKLPCKLTEKKVTWGGLKKIGSEQLPNRNMRSVGDKAAARGLVAIALPLTIGRFVEMAAKYLKRWKCLAHR